MVSIKKYINLSRNDLVELVNSKYAEQTSSTLKAFEEALKRIEIVYGSSIANLKFEFISKPGELVEKMILRNYSENTIINMLSNLCKICKVCDLNSKYINLIRGYMYNYRKSLDAEKQQNIKSEYETTNWVEWQDIHKEVLLLVPYYLDNNNNISKLDYMRFLLLALFVLHTPRRYGNYMDMDVFTTNMKLNALLDIKNRNFLLIDTTSTTEYTFIFNKYKTSKFIGSQIYKVIDIDLIQLLDKWFNNYNTDKRYLFINSKGDEIKRTTIIEQMKLITKEIYKKSFSVDILRHSFISNFIASNPTIQKKIKIAYELGQTYKPQQLDFYNRT